MNADFIAGLEFWEREKGISRETLMAAVQEALLSAAKKAVGPARELRVDIDQKSGDIRAFDVMPNGLPARQTERVIANLRGNEPGGPDGL